MNKKTIAIALTCVLLLCCVVGGTMAWLTASAGPVENTFTIGDINIELKEHVYNPDTGALKTDTTIAGNNYKFVPGDTLPKDPFVTVVKGSEKCYLFIKVTETYNSIEADGVKVDPILDYSVKTGENDWISFTPAEGTYSNSEGTSFYYRIVDASKAEASLDFDILTDNHVTVSTAVTKSMVPVINGAEGTTAKSPALTFEAAAIQYKNIAAGTDASADAAAAFGNLPDAFTGKVVQGE